MNKIDFIYLVLSLLLVGNIVLAAKYEFDHKLSKYECKKWMKKCSYTLVVTDCYSMQRDALIVYSDNRSIRGFNDSGWFDLTNDNVVTLDGTYLQKMMCINGSFPGPLIVAYEGQMLNIRFINNLNGESFTVHFHGMHQKGTNNMDGVPSIEQDPIEPGSFYDYRFYASPHGSFWYHSHQHSFFTLNGPLMILPRDPIYKPKSEFALMMSDYPENFNAIRDIDIINKGTLLFNPPVLTNQSNRTQQLIKDAIASSSIVFKITSHCINGKCESPDPTKKMPLEVLDVQAKSTYRLRLINSAARNTYLITIDNHKLKMISLDGMDINPVSNLDSVIIFPGERIDVLVSMDQTPNNYWIRAQTVNDDCILRSPNNSKAMGILRYLNSPKVDPTTTANPCNTGNKCLTYGCFKKDQFPLTQCVTINDITSLDEQSWLDAANSWILPSPREIHYFNFDIINSYQAPRFGINYLSLKVPDVLKNLPTPYDDLSELNRIRKSVASCDKCPPVLANIKSFCSCYHSLEIASSYFKYEYLLFSDLNKDVRIFRPGMHEHPAHLHGHHFEVLKFYMPPLNDTTVCNSYQKVPEITCDNEGKDEYLKYGCLNERFNVDLKSLNLNLVNPVKKDTVVVPRGGYVLVRFKPDNPGIWPLHCHNFFHHLGAMMMTINVY